MSHTLLLRSILLAMRLFIAIDLPQEVKRELWYLALSLEHQAQRARVIPPENYHLTLLFIGETKRVNEVRDTLHRLRLPGEPVEVALEGIGSFKHQRDRTWWVGVKVTEVLEDLYRQLIDLYRAADFDIDARPFTPHVTLARKVKASEPIVLEVPQLVIEAERISLMKSTFEDERMVYTEIDSVEML